MFVVLRYGVGSRFDSMVWHLFAALFPRGFCEITISFFEVLAGRGGLWQEGVACLQHQFRFVPLNLPSPVGFSYL